MGVPLICSGGRARIALGQLSQAAERGRASVDLAERLGEPLLRAVAHWGLAYVEIAAGRLEAGAHHARIVGQLAQTLGLRPFAAAATLLEADALVRQHRYDEAIDLAWRQIEGARKRGGLLPMEAPIAFAIGKVGRAAEGLGRIEQVIAHYRANGDCSMLSPTLRLRGELLAMLGRDDAEAALNEAISIAREQGAAGYLAEAERALAAWRARGGSPA